MRAAHEIPKPTSCESTEEWLLILHKMTEKFCLRNPKARRSDEPARLQYIPALRPHLPWLIYGGLATLLSVLAITLSAIMVAAYMDLRAGITITISATMAFAMGFGAVCQLVSEPSVLSGFLLTFVLVM